MLQHHVIVQQTFELVVHRMLDVRSKRVNSKGNTAGNAHFAGKHSRLSDMPFTMKLETSEMSADADIQFGNKPSLQEISQARLHHLRRIHSLFRVCDGMPYWAKRKFQISPINKAPKDIEKCIRIAYAYETRSIQAHFLTENYARIQQKIRPIELLRELHRLKQTSETQGVSWGLRYQKIAVRRLLKEPASVKICKMSPKSSKQLSKDLVFARRRLTIRKAMRIWKDVVRRKMYFEDYANYTERMTKYGAAVRLRLRHLYSIRAAQNKRHGGDSIAQCALGGSAYQSSPAVALCG